MLTEVSFTGSNWTRLRPDLTARSTTSFRSRNSPEPTSSSVRMEKTGTASPAPFQGTDWWQEKTQFQPPGLCFLEYFAEG